jgi:hypothetical protein
LYSTSNIIGMLKSRKIRSAGHVACTGEACISGFGRKKTTYEHLDTNGWIILKWILTSEVVLFRVLISPAVAH